MNSAAAYLLRIIATAMLCGILGTLFGKSPYAKLGKMIIGLIMVLTVVQPVVGMDVQDILPNLDAFSTQADWWVQQGTATADATVDAMIAQQVQNYIQEKAVSMGATLTVTPIIKDGIPVGVTLTGNAAPYVQARLAQWLERELGIAKEAQTWIGNTG